MGVKALEQETCEDCISRKKAIRIAEQGQIQGYVWQFKKLCNLSSVQPVRKKGKWIELGYTIPDVQSNKEWECNQCYRRYRWFEPTPNYCPNCGAKMGDE